MLLAVLRWQAREIAPIDCAQDLRHLPTPFGWLMKSMLAFFDLRSERLLRVG